MDESNNSNNKKNKNSNCNAGKDACQQSLLGSFCSVRVRDSVVRRGQLLEVRYLWTAALLKVDGNSRPQPPLYGFVRLKDVDHRMSGWFSIGDIELKIPKNSSSSSCYCYCGSGGSCCCGNNNSNNNNNNNSSSTDAVKMPLNPSMANRICGPILSGVYKEVTPGMIRTRREEKQLDFFEERLLRDCRTPTTVRYFVYLGTYVFSPWYYAPYGLLNAEYDPLAPLDTEENVQQQQQQHGLGVAAGVAANTNPYIRDAFLCPFSLRIYSTFDQLAHETKCYRSEKLRPPGHEIYRDDTRGFSLFEVNGSRQVTYCRHLFLLGKSFLENKLAGHDVHNYYFYVLCLHHRHFAGYTNDQSAMYFVGYFSWEKQVADHNLACIVTLPCFAGGPRHRVEDKRLNIGHFGQFMIAASYELAYRRKQIGSPERPLSDLGASAYERYWRRLLIAWMYKRLWQAAELIAESDEDSEGQNGATPPSVVTVNRTKRPRAESSGQISGLEDDRGVRAARPGDLASTSVRSIAQEVRLEEADVLRTLLRMGLLHRNAEDRSLRLVIPVDFVRREYAKEKEAEVSLTRAVFDPSLMTSRGSAPCVASGTSTFSSRSRQRQATTGN